MISVQNPNITDDNYQQKSYNFGADFIFGIDRLSLFFKDHPFIIRAKGHVRTEKGWNLVNHTLSDCIFEPCQEKDQSEIILITEKSERLLDQCFDAEFEKTILNEQTHHPVASVRERDPGKRSDSVN